MKRTFFVVLIAVAMPTLAARAAPAPVATLNPQQHAKLTSLEAQLTPVARAKLDPLIAQVRVQLRGTTPGDPAATANSAVQRSFPSASPGQADQLTFIVMAEAASQSDADLKSLMDQMQHANQVSAKPSPSPHVGGLDSTTELGEMESLRMQLAMDRYSKFMTAISNLEKKISETDTSIIGNLK
jgi:hypothetical protein